MNSPRVFALVMMVVSAVVLTACRTDQPIAPTEAATAKPVDPIDAEAAQYAQTVEQAMATGTAAPPPADVQWLPLGADQARPAPRPAAATTRTNQPTAIAPPPAAVAPPAPAATTRHTPAAPLDQRELVKRLSSALAADARTQRKSLRPYIARAALSLTDPRQELTEADLAALSAEDRRVVLAWQRTFSQLGLTLAAGDTDGRAALRDAAEELAGQVESWQKLKIRNVRLCTRVDGYGNYQTFGSHTFLAGRAQPMIVYAELDNFATETQTNGKHVVKLTQEVILFNESDGLPVWRQRPVPIKDESFNRRRDFFIVQIITLSDRLTVGKYLLKVSVTDEIGKAVDEVTLPVQIVADPNLVNR
jgi:hypothetical protein